MTLLEQKRLDAGLTREQLAERTATVGRLVPERTIRHLEGALTRTPRLKTVEPLAKVLDVAPSVLVRDFIDTYDQRVAAEAAA